MSQDQRCNHCGKTFKNQMALYGHRRTCKLQNEPTSSSTSSSNEQLDEAHPRAAQVRSGEGSELLAPFPLSYTSYKDSSAPPDGVALDENEKREAEICKIGEEPWRLSRELIGVILDKLLGVRDTARLSSHELSAAHYYRRRGRRMRQDPDGIMLETAMMKLHRAYVDFKQQEHEATMLSQREQESQQKADEYNQALRRKEAEDDAVRGDYDEMSSGSTAYDRMSPEERQRVDAEKDDPYLDGPASDRLSPAERARLGYWKRRR